MRSFWLLLLVAVQCASAEPIVVKDDAGLEVVLDQPARRIISLAPHTTEALFAAGAGQWVVGAVEYSDYPPEANDIPRVGSYNAMDIEAIVSKQPDLVVAWKSGNPTQIIEKLKSLGVTVYLSEPQRMNLIPSNIERLGRLAGQGEGAASFAEQFRQRLDHLRDKHRDNSKVRVFYQVWDRPLMTVSGRQMISEAIELCGGENVFADLNGLAPQIDIEAVLVANPEAIIFATEEDRVPLWKGNWQRWRQLEAVQKKNIFSLNPDLVSRHGPRILDGAEALCQSLEIVRSKR